MHVGGITVDLNWFLQLILTIFIIAFGLLHLVKNTASKYFEVDANFEGTDRNHHVMPSLPIDTPCAVCGNHGEKRCSRCKSVKYCSHECQQRHWKSGHKTKCRDQSEVNSMKAVRTGLKSSGVGGKKFPGIALVPVHGGGAGGGASKAIKKPRKVLFPYDEFVKLFNRDLPELRPCGLLNCGNSCFANVVLQCLTYTKPLVAYLLEKGHREECRRDDWCFLCEFQTHVEKARQSQHPFSPMSILSRLPNIGGNLGYGRQEDAHEFMRFAIDTMQSICLDEFGGEKAVNPIAQETTLIQHIFGGHLQSQVICTNCNNISNQYENMMDLTVEIHGDAASLEECLDQFTVKEWLHGDNMYKCDGCNDYVKAWKRLTVRRAPNILTIALKRFQSGRFGKLNKRVSFPETLDLSPYMSEEGDGSDVYKLYGVVVHVDMLNASFFGHYICYMKDFRGNWYRIDDCKVVSVELEEVLSQGAYMLLYSRVSARPSYLVINNEPSTKEELKEMNVEVESSQKEESFKIIESIDPVSGCEPLISDDVSNLRVLSCENESGDGIDSQALTEHFEDTNVGDIETSSIVSEEVSSHENGLNREAVRGGPENMDVDNAQSSSFVSMEVSRHESGLSCEAVRGDSENLDVDNAQSSSLVSEEVSGYENGFNCEAGDLEIMDVDNTESSSFASKEVSENGFNRESVNGDPENLDVDEAKSSSFASKEVPENGLNCEAVRGESERLDMNDTQSSSFASKEVSSHENGLNLEAVRGDPENLDNAQSSSFVSKVVFSQENGGLNCEAVDDVQSNSFVSKEVFSHENGLAARGDSEKMNGQSSSCDRKNLSNCNGSEVVREDPEDRNMVNSDPYLYVSGNGNDSHAMDCEGVMKDSHAKDIKVNSSTCLTSSVRAKCESPFNSLDVDDKNGSGKVNSDSITKDTKVNGSLCSDRGHGSKRELSFNCMDDDGKNGFKRAGIVENS